MSLKVQKITLYEVELDGTTYRGNLDNWEELIGSSWEPMSPWRKEKVDEAFRAWRAQRDSYIAEGGDR